MKVYGGSTALETRLWMQVERSFSHIRSCGLILQLSGLERNSFSFAFLLNLLSNNTFSDLKTAKNETNTNPESAPNYTITVALRFISLSFQHIHGKKQKKQQR